MNNKRAEDALDGSRLHDPDDCQSHRIMVRILLCVQGRFRNEHHNSGELVSIYILFPRAYPTARAQQAIGMQSALSGAITLRRHLIIFLPLCPVNREQAFHDASSSPTGTAHKQGNLAPDLLGRLDPANTRLYGPHILRMCTFSPSFRCIMWHILRKHEARLRRVDQVPTAHQNVLIATEEACNEDLAYLVSPVPLLPVLHPRYTSSIPTICVATKCHIFRLPDELLLDICETFCLHCQDKQSPESLPFESRTAMVNQLILSKLSRVCRKLRDVCQPILYHYHLSTGLYGSSGNPPFAQDCPSQLVPDRLMLFLRTVVECPNLARAVRILLLHPPDELGLLDCQLNRIRSGASQGFLAPLWDNPTHYTLQRLAVDAVKSGLEYLLLARGSGGIGGDRLCDWRTIGCLPKLTRLALLGDDDVDYHIQERYELLHIAPHLTALFAADCGCEYDAEVRELYDYAPVPTPISLGKLRKLSINGPTLQSLQHLIRCCPQLEDLELHIDPCTYSDPLASALDICKGTLRRLVLSISPPTFPNHDQWEPDEDADAEDIDALAQLDAVTKHLEMPAVVGQAEYEQGFSFHDFEALEILEVDQSVLFGFSLRQDRVPQGYLASKLPTSISVLHVGFVLSWAHMYWALPDMSHSRQAGHLPHLDTVHLDPLEDHSVHIPFHEHDRIRSALEVSGIRLLLGANSAGERLRGMLAERPGGVHKHILSGYQYPL